MNRGGSWINHPRNCRVAYRNNAEPDNRNNNIGFRLARSSRPWWIPGRQDGFPHLNRLLSRFPRGTNSIHLPDQLVAYSKADPGYFSFGTCGMSF
ncbi:MAG: SUMF1/EgtB/PvdO family nonheme iron enzyme [Bacteroidota bacterium]